MSQPLPDAKNEIKKALVFKLLQRESRFEELSDAILTTKANEALAKQCPVCRRIFGEHSDEELIRCIEA